VGDPRTKFKVKFNLMFGRGNKTSASIPININTNVFSPEKCHKVNVIVVFYGIRRLFIIKSNGAPALT